MEGCQEHSFEDRLQKKPTSVFLLIISKWPVAVVLGYKDPVAPTKILIDFAKKNPELENQSRDAG